MKHAPFIQNRKTGPSRKYPSPAFLGRKTKTAIKQKTENKEAKKKKLVQKQNKTNCNPTCSRKMKSKCKTVFPLQLLLLFLLLLSLASSLILLSSLLLLSSSAVRQ